MMPTVLVAGLVVVLVVLVRVRRASAARRVAEPADPAVLVALRAFPPSADGIGRHRAPVSSRFFHGSRGAM